MQYKIFMWLWPVSVACLPVLNALAKTGPESAGVGTFPFYLFLSFFFVVWSIGNCVWRESYTVLHLFEHISDYSPRSSAACQIVVNKLAPSPETLASINVCSRLPL